MFLFGAFWKTLKVNHFVHVCARVCVCKWVCLCVCVGYVCMKVGMFVWVCRCVPVQQVCVFRCVCVCGQVHKCACSFVCAGGCIHVHIHFGCQRLTLPSLGTLSFELGSLNWTCCSWFSWIHCPGKSPGSHFFLSVSPQWFVRAFYAGAGIKLMLSCFETCTLWTEPSLFWLAYLWESGLMTTHV